MDFCNEDFVSIYELIGVVFKIVKYILPLIIIFFGTFDLYKSVVNLDGNSIKKSLVSFLRRIGAGLLIFFLPSIIIFMFDAVGLNQNDNSCIYNCILDTKKCSSNQSKNNNLENGNKNDLDNILKNNDGDIDYSIYIK